VKYPPEVIREWFEKLHDERVNMTAWEDEFVESVEIQFEMRGTLTDRQVEFLEDIYTRRTP
jgi:hypothetical protein